MPNERLQGTFKVAGPPKALPRLFKEDIRLGLVDAQSGVPLADSLTLADAEDAYTGTTFSLIVYKPSAPHHVPGVFFRLSNGTGSTFARLTPSDVWTLLGWLSTQVPLALDAFEIAADAASLITKVDNELQEQLKKVN